VRRGDRPNRFQIRQRHRMTAAGIDAEFDVNATNLLGAFFLDQALKLGDIDIPFERFLGKEIMGVVDNHVDDLRSAHFDMGARRGKQHIAGDNAARFDVDLDPDPFRRAPLRRWH